MPARLEEEEVLRRQASISFDKGQKAHNLSETVSKSDLGEQTQSNTGYPLSPQLFAQLSFYTHLVDLTRYEDLEIVLFVESLGSVLPLVLQKQHR